MRHLQTGVFYGRFIFVCSLHKIHIVCIIFNDHLTKACWQKPLKCGEKITQNSNPKGKKAIPMCCLDGRQKRKQGKKQNLRKITRWQMLFYFRWLLVCCLLTLLSYRLWRFVNFLCYTQTKEISRTYTGTQAHRHADTYSNTLNRTDWGRGAR